ncbi:MAG: sodium-dependent transporter [Planctomycetota bacterium]|nr:sodium-dependent transporter [Planctomycetota bacterium]
MSEGNESTTRRGQWSSRWGFILASAGCAIGLGNIWKFPYITGENGGGLFVLIYLGCIALIGLPIMLAEVLLGRATQKSPVGAYRDFSCKGSPWVIPGWIGVMTGFIILSYYSVVAGWALHYTWLSLQGGFSGMDAEQISSTFGSVFSNGTLNLGWHSAFMLMTVAVVIGGVRSGVERIARILMPLLFVMLLVLLGLAMQSDGFSEAFSFVFSPDASKLTRAGVLEALGHSFFTLSLGMGAMITYGSYLKKKEDIVSAVVVISILDTVIALVACLVLFPIIFSFGMEPKAGPGLVFVSLPIAFSQMAGGAVWATVFFALLVFAALTSAISMLEVVVSTIIDETRIKRTPATLLCGAAIYLFGIPSALSGTDGFAGEGFKKTTAVVFGEDQGKNWFDTFDYLASNWLLPLGGLMIAVFVAYRAGEAARRKGFEEGTRFQNLYVAWLLLLRYLVPIGVVAVLLHALKII